MEFWAIRRVFPETVAQVASELENGGWDGQWVPDTQNVLGDTYVMLTIAALSTTRLQVGTGVTNPYTRHPVVAASAIASVQAVSGGRVVFGIGRGDSSLAHLGLAPASPDRFARYLEQIQAYLRGEDVDFNAQREDDVRKVDDLNLAGAPEGSRLLWLSDKYPKVPVDVAASGPKVIGIGARLADRVTFALGADPARLEWAVNTARNARTEAGLDPSGISFGAYVAVVAHPDAAVARDLNAVGVSMQSRFSVMDGKLNGPVDDVSRAELQRLAQNYDMNKHGHGDADHRNVLSDQVVDRFGISGNPSQVIERLKELEALGLDRIIVLNALSDRPDDEKAVATSRRALEEDVLPAFAGS